MRDVCLNLYVAALNKPRIYSLDFRIVLLKQKPKPRKLNIL